ncbi:cupin domain-containing protein [Roseomonas sp. OT10]|uniref:cupin domain-containing protein n=1 Tax=Roseomonas cutis TaxID=2897332 RepID=UPI001E49F9CD|nr:cupin domain-containing protein [Roseomonas sp. OT10]UFN49694.1 cupin domain-containing protein [Roseomonas sp. OT10]
MNAITKPAPASPAQASLAAELQRHIGRHAQKSFDWDAFPSNRGYPELARAQMRYIGAGGSPKVGDSATMKPDHFTLSLIYKEPGKYAACHAHEIEESFLILKGVLTVGWEQDNRVVEVKLGPKDMILNARDVPHGFRNEGVEPVLMSISVDVGAPQPPRYAFHPKDTDAALARAFGAKPGQTEVLSAEGSHPLQQLMAHHVIRFAEQPTIWDAAGFSRKVYVGEGGVQSTTARKEMIGIPRGVGVKPYVRPVEDAYLVTEGVVTVGWLGDDGEAVEAKLGPLDVVKTPAGRPHWFRNDDMADAQMFLVVGEPGKETVRFEKA